MINYILVLSSYIWEEGDAMQTAKTKNRVNHTIIVSALQLVVGVILLIVLTVVAMVEFGLSFVHSETGRQALWVFLLGLGQCAVLFWLSIRDILLVLRYRKLVRAMEDSGAHRIGIAALAEKLGITQEKLLSDLAVMFARGFFTAAAGIDEERCEFVRDEEGPLPPPLDENNKTRLTKKRCRRFLLPTLYFVGVWAVYAAFGGFSRWWELIVVGAISLVVWVAGVLKTPRYETWVETVRPEEKKEPVKTGNEDLDDVLTVGMDYMQKLFELDRKISSPALDEPVRQLTEISREIFDVIGKTPKKARQIRQFIHYYLPTTLKLLQEYTEFEALAIGGENVRESMRKIEGIMDTIVIAFKRELDALYLDKAIDISSDIEVLRGMIG